MSIESRASEWLVGRSALRISLTRFSLIPGDVRSATSKASLSSFNAPLCLLVLLPSPLSLAAYWYLRCSWKWKRKLCQHNLLDEEGKYWLRKFILRHGFIKENDEYCSNIMRVFNYIGQQREDDAVENRTAWMLELLRASWSLLLLFFFGGWPMFDRNLGLALPLALLPFVNFQSLVSTSQHILGASQCRIPTRVVIVATVTRVGCWRRFWCCLVWSGLYRRQIIMLLLQCIKFS